MKFFKKNDYSLLNHTKFLYQKAFDYSPKYRFELSFYTICMITSPLIAILIPTIAVDLITNNTNISTFVIKMGAISLVYAITNSSARYLSNTIDNTQTAIRTQPFYVGHIERLMDLDYCNIEPFEKQQILTKAMASLSSNWVGVELFYKSFPMVIINLFGLLIYSSLIINFNIWVLFIFITMTLLNFTLSKHAREYDQKNKDEYTKLDRKIDYLYQQAKSLVNGKDIRLYKMNYWFNQTFNSLIKKRINIENKIQFNYFLPQLSDQILLFIRDLTAYYILINMVINKEISITLFTFYLGIISGFANWLTEFANNYDKLKAAIMKIEDYRFVDTIENHFNHKQGIDIKTLKRPLSIEFKNVCFSYPDSKEMIIKNLNFVINAGEKIALVGNNGAGKTTLVKLLSGLYYPTSGEILINDYPITAFNINDYYQLIATVFQDVQSLALTIEDNIASTNVNKEKLWECLKLAELDTKINSLIHKEKTYLSQQLDSDGVQLSGGQMQKLMLARALYKDAALLILDEPTSALDPIAEASLYEKYNQLAKDKTAIFISHRLSSTQFCDKIIFFESGEIVENGNHEQLMQLNGKYAEMFKIQSHYYKENPEVLTNETIF